MLFSKLISNPGRRTLSLGQPNGDAALERDCGTYKIQVLCDGASQCLYGTEAAQAIASATADYLAMNFPRAMFEPEDVIRRELTLTVMKIVSHKAAELGCGKEDLGCTILAAAMDELGRFCFFHLGDGLSIGKFDEDCEWMIFSYPQRDLGGGTFLTGKAPIFPHLQFGRADRKCNSTLVLMTDGFQEILHGSWELLNHPERLNSGVSAEDDWTVAWMSATPYPPKSRSWLIYPEGSNA